MDQELIKQIVAKNSEEAKKVSHFVKTYQSARQNAVSPMAAFDSMSATQQVALPSSLATLFNSDFTQNAGLDSIQNAVLTGLEVGTNEYKRRHGGDAPAMNVIQAAFDNVSGTFTNLKDVNVQKALKDMVETQNAFDSMNGVGMDNATNLTTPHHAPMGVVPAMVMVTLMNNIANALPIVAQLPNANGNNEVPLIFYKTTTNKRWGAMDKGDDVDGAKSGLPYLENRYTLVMTKADAKFSTPVHVGLTPHTISGKKNIHFVADTSTDKAPFLGGAVVVLVNGTPVADDRNAYNVSTSEVTVLQAINGQAVEIWDETSKSKKSVFVKTGKANLKTHTIEVEFDGDNNHYVPDENMVVEVEVVFDYERKDDKGNLILTPPGFDMSFVHYSVFARPSRVKTDASIDAVTQMQNELNIPWQAAVLGVIQQKYMVEQNARLLREAANAARNAPSLYVTEHNGYKTGVQNTNLSDKLGEIVVSIGKGRAKQSQNMNAPVAGVDVFVDIETAPLFNAMPADRYTPTGQPYGDNSSIYRIGTLNDGANVYYVPQSFGVLDAPEGVTFQGLNDNAREGTKNYMFMQLPKVYDPAKAPFVGHTAVAPLIYGFANGSGETSFEHKIERYARVAADRNPNPRYRNQAQLILLKNMPIV